MGADLILARVQFNDGSIGYFDAEQYVELDGRHISDVRLVSESGSEPEHAEVMATDDLIQRACAHGGIQ